MSLDRVLLISSNSSARGGGERYLVYLVQGLCQLGVAPHVLLSTVTYMDGWAQELAQAGAVVHRRPLRGLVDRRLRFVQAMLDSRQARVVADVCRQVAPSGIVVNQQYDEDGLDYLAGALQSRCAPVAGVMHMPMTAQKHQRPFGRWRQRLLARWYAAHPYRLILVSEGAQAEFEACYAAPRPTWVINNGIPLEGVAQAARAFHPGHEAPPVIGFVGQFVPQKNLSALLDAWLALRQGGSMARLLLVGDGPERPAIEARLAQAAPAGGWSITGWTDRPETFLDQMAVFVLCSHFEGLPLSLVEAAARGIPCVVTPFNGASDVASRARWVQVTPDHSPDALHAGLASFLAGLDRHTPATAEERQAFSAHFSMRRMAADVLDVLQAVRAEAASLSTERQA
jgi:glycosyltransferase involved in cell wall biosynthesis